mgnify:CR=1 FL=1
MKVKIFALVAAFFMLMGGSAWAQSDVKGDVNKDGVVNEQDIAAILAIMAKNNGVAEKTRYYWYVGQENPANMTSISPIVTENGVTGWRLIDTSKSYTFGNPIYTSDAYPVESNLWWLGFDCGHAEDGIDTKKVKLLKFVQLQVHYVYLLLVEHLLTLQL